MPIGRHQFKEAFWGRAVPTIPVAYGPLRSRAKRDEERVGVHSGRALLRAFGFVHEIGDAAVERSVDAAPFREANDLSVEEVDLGEALSQARATLSSGERCEPAA